MKNLYCHRLIVTISLITILLYTSVQSAILPLAKAIKAIDQKLYYKALNILDAYNPKPEELPVYFFIKGKALKGLKKYRQAIEYLNRAFITSKDRELRREALFERGLAYLYGGFYYEAASNFKLYIKLFPEAENIQEAYINYAQSSLMSGNLEEALKYFKELKVDRPEVIFGKAEVFHKLGLYKTAFRLFSEGYKKYSKYLESHPSILLSYAENLFITGHFKRAKPFYYMLTETPLKEKAYLGLGKISLKEKDLDTALMYFKRARYSADRVIKREALLYIGLVSLEKNEVEKAISMFLKLRKDYPYTPEANKGLLILSSIYRKQGNYLLAEKYLKELLYGTEPSEEALKELENLILTTIEHDRKAFLKTWKDCGRLLMTIKRQNTLLKVAKALMDEGGDFLKVYNFLIRNGNRSIKAIAIADMAVFYGRLGDIENLNKYYLKLRRLKIKNDHYYRVLAYKYALEGKDEQSLVFLAKIKAYEGSDFTLLYMIVDGVNPYKFLDTYKRLSRQFKNKLDYQLIGDVFYDHGYLSDAAKYYKLALKVGEYEPHTLYRLYRIEEDNSEVRSILLKQKDIFGKSVKLNLMEKKLLKEIREL